MNKLLAGLLIAAIGAGAFFFLRYKKSETHASFQKELLIGKWKIDSLDVKTKDSSAYLMAVISAIDSNFSRYHYDFRTDGNVLKSVMDAAKADTSHYEWSGKNELVWKENPNDSTSEIFVVTKLNSDSLLLQSKDSAVVFFSKLK
jgi:hypothetical protein